MERQRKVDFRGELVERSEKLSGDRQVMQEVAKKMAGKVVKGRGRSRLGGTGLLPLSGRRFHGLQQAAVSVHVCVPWPFARGLPQLIPQNSGRLSSETFTFWSVRTPGDAAQNSLGVPSSPAGFPAFPESVTSAEVPAARWVQGPWPRDSGDSSGHTQSRRRGQSSGHAQP